MPQVVKAKIPAAFRYWEEKTEAKAKEVRDLLVEKIRNEEIEIEFDELLGIPESDSSVDKNLHGDLQLQQKAKERTQSRIRSGLIQSCPCAKCGSTKGQIDAHHDDYMEPDKITWLCQKHHKTLHRIWRQLGLKNLKMVAYLSGADFHKESTAEGGN